MNNTIRIYTDGSANYRNGLGGIGVYIIDGDNELFLQKGLSNTKVGRCEIRALLLALQSIQDKSRQITIYSDSQYVVFSIEKKWAERWESESWLGRSNSDLWKEVLFEYRQFKPGSVKLVHIKGHQEDISDCHIYGNNVADILADYHQFNEREKDEI